MGVRYTTSGKLRKGANPYKAIHPKSWQNYEEQEAAKGFGQAGVPVSSKHRVWFNYYLDPRSITP